MSRGSWLRRMISRERLREAVRAKGFRFKRETKKAQIYVRSNDGTRVFLRQASFHREKAARSVLHAAGYSNVEIEAFLAESRKKR